MEVARHGRVTTMLLLLRWSSCSAGVANSTYQHMHGLMPAAGSKIVIYHHLKLCRSAKCPCEKHMHTQKQYGEAGGLHLDYNPETPNPRSPPAKLAPGNLEFILPSAQTTAPCRILQASARPSRAILQQSRM